MGQISTGTDVKLGHGIEVLPEKRAGRIQSGGSILLPLPTTTNDTFA
jgi:hypothetical protein